MTTPDRERINGLLAELETIIAHDIVGPKTGTVWRITATWASGRTWSRRFFTESSARNTRSSLLNPAPRPVSTNDPWNGEEWWTPEPAETVVLEAADIMRYRVIE